MVSSTQQPGPRCLSSCSSFIMPSSSSLPQPILASNTAHIEHDALTALESLLARESHPIYACGRAYLENLTRWRDHLVQLDSPGQSTRARDEHDANEFKFDIPPSPLSSEASTASLPNDAPRTPRDRPTVHPTSLLPHSRIRVATPSQCPNTLISWRARVIEWLFDLADALGFERNTAVAAVGYLDVYSMYCLFPDEFARRMGAISSEGNQDVSSNDDTEIAQKFFSFSDKLGTISSQMYLLAATSSFYTAAKLYQTAPRIFTLSHAARVAPQFLEEDVEAMERAIVKTLTFHLNPATTARFLKEMLVLLLDHEETFCEAGWMDEQGKPVITKRKHADVGTFRSTTWFPQSVVETTIYRHAFYLADLVSYSCVFPVASSALPSKVAFAAIVEAATQNYFMEDQIAFQERLEELSCLNDAFDYNAEIADIRKCMRWILNRNGDRDAMREMDGASPVTVVDGEPSPAKRQKFWSTKSENVPKSDANKSAASSTSNSKDGEINHSESKQKKYLASGLFNARATNAANGGGIRDCLVRESLEEPQVRAPSTRPSCSAHVHLFDGEKPKAFKRVSQTVG
ncbi:hypothetical protein HJC23_008719 [Cyclotella cryptica]|uniref:Cyclin C-terminal domain-containing protein n=1 Tax=Cyclotella cryptica TaxID=29204 RepID=A0ABD3PEE9_9STRA|eukprot:CCRYP_015808-RA/>CCRYP_015808-RA protein AED:0.10 eAED:0.10 QI:0/-1/0/1/-1/1/1/0/573